MFRPNIFGTTSTRTNVGHLFLPVCPARTVTLVSWVVCILFIVFCPKLAIAQFPVVTVTATDSNAAEQGAKTGSFSVTRSGATAGHGAPGSALTVNCTISGTAAIGMDYTISPSCPVTIPVGSPSVTVTITPVDDTTVEGAESVILTVTASAGYTVGSPSAATITIADDTVVSVAAPDPTAAEQGRNPGSFSITRSGSTAQSLAVICSIGGTATGSDYTISPSCPKVTIPAGSASVTLTVTPVDDSAIEPDETVVLTVEADSHYIVATSTGTVTIVDNDKPVITVTAPDPNAAEQGRDPGTFSIARTGLTTSPLTVNCTIAGTATSGDYTIAPSCTVTIPAGAASVTVTVTPIDDTVVEGAETVALTVAAGSGYDVGSPSVATITIADNDTNPAVTVTAPDPNAAEQGQDTGTFSVARTGATTSPLTVNCTIGGTASTSDYTVAPSCPVTIPAGAASISVTVTPIDDPAVEGDETVTLTLASGAGYTLGAATVATIIIADNDTVPVDVTVTAPDPNAAEQGQDTGTFSIALTGATTSPLTVNCTIGGTASTSVDYTVAPSCPITIPAGAASISVTVTPIDDTAVEGDETVFLTLTSGGGYALGAATVATIIIADNDTVPVDVTVTAPDPNAAEQGQNAGTFSIARTGPATSPLTVNCTIAGTATSGADYTIAPSCPVTIPAGAASVTVTVTPIDDTAVEGDETVILNLAAGAGYTLGTPGGATIIIADNDSVPVDVTVTATDANAAEQGQDIGTFSITRTGPTTSPLTVNCAIGGTATFGSDYTVSISPACLVTIPAGTTSVTLTVTPVDDALVEGDETVALTVRPGSDYSLGTSSTATINIVDNEPLLLTMSSGSAIPSSLPASANPPIRLALGIPPGVIQPSASLEGRVEVSFTPDAQGVEDPNMRFQNGQKSVNFTIGAGSTQAVFVDANGGAFAGPPPGTVGFQPGTNAGTITFSVILGGTTTAVTTKIERAPPVVTSLRVQRTSNGMSVSVVGFSTTRDMTSVTFTFSGSAGVAPAISPSGVTDAFASYFARRDDSALKNGSIFLLTIPFTITTGLPEQFDSVKVTLTNSAGVSEMTTKY